MEKMIKFIQDKSTIVDMPVWKYQLLLKRSNGVTDYTELQFMVQQLKTNLIHTYTYMILKIHFLTRTSILKSV